MSVIGLILWWAINIYFWVLLGRVVLSFVPAVVPGWTPRGVLLVLAEVLYTLTDPPLKLISRVVPPVRLGAAALDFSPLVLIFALQLLQVVVRLIFF
ncbi:YggT family protein [Tessaracoccus sp. OH4464_COT-324]|nr:YggT family protein [Tessaracoccus sp. OH4464_COT-324]